ncbi:MAG: hypothetical protein EP343_00230 [Deltaproteobacteria bacterium]|nr:MAG: hypothetical protein EP343_00230 [Deltaproteobacteria bacterium]
MSATKHHNFLHVLCQTWDERRKGTTSEEKDIQETLFQAMLEALGVEAELHLEVHSLPWSLNGTSWDEGTEDETAQAFHEVLQEAHINSLTFLPYTTGSDMVQLLDILIPPEDHDQTAESELPNSLSLRVEMKKPGGEVVALPNETSASDDDEKDGPAEQASDVELQEAEDAFFDNDPTRPGKLDSDPSEELPFDLPTEYTSEATRISTRIEPRPSPPQDSWPTVIPTRSSPSSEWDTQSGGGPAEISLSSESYGYLTDLFSTMDSEQLYEHFLSQKDLTQLQWEHLEDSSEPVYAPASDEYEAHSSLEGQFAEYVQQLLSAQLEQSQRIQGGERVDMDALHGRQALQETMWIHEQLRNYLSQFPATLQHQSLLPIVAVELLRLDPVLLLEHFVALQSHVTMLGALMRNMFERGEEDALWQLLQYVLIQAERVSDPQIFQVHTKIVQGYVEASYQRGWEHRLVLLLQSLSKRPNQPTSPQLQGWYHSILTTVGLPKNLAFLFQQARQGSDVTAHQLLGLLFPLSLWHGIRELEALRHPFARTRHIDVLQRLGQRVPAPIVHSTLANALDQISSLSLGTQQCLLALVRWYHPGLLEEFLVKRLPYVKSSQIRQVLLEQAIALNTPFVKQLLLHLLRGFVLARDPQQEEAVLLVLHKERLLDGPQLLHQRAFQTSMDVGVRCNAVWMLGAFPSNTTFSMLQTLLCDPKPPNESPVVWEALRFQALFTLQRFPLTATERLLQQGKRSQSFLHQMGARVLLRETLPADFRSLFEETEKLRQANTEW